MKVYVVGSSGSVNIPSLAFKIDKHPSVTWPSPQKNTLGFDPLKLKGWVGKFFGSWMFKEVLQGVVLGAKLPKAVR